MSDTTTITVEQLNSDGSVARSFEYHPFEHEVDSVLKMICQAYNLNNTRVRFNSLILLLRPEVYS